MSEKTFKLVSKERFKIKSCPCGKSNKDGKFVPFDGYVSFGYCHACSETFYPNKESDDGSIKVKVEGQPASKIVTIPKSYLFQSTRKLNDNLSIFLSERFGQINIGQIKRLYYLGNSKQWPGATVFWYIDLNQNVRTGKIMLYNKDNGKRVKEPYNHITWVHRSLGIPNENISKCLFGEHLIYVFPQKPVAIVESEKTAIIASMCFPDFIWMATGGLGNLSYEKLKPIKDRKIVLFPDLGAYEIWSEKANYLKQWFSISVSDYLQINSTEKEKGLKYDIADFLLQ